MISALPREAASCLFSVTGMSRMAANERWSEGEGDRERGAILGGVARWRC